MDRRHRGSVCIGLMALIGAACAGLGLAQPPAEKPGAAHAAVRPFSVEGVYVEACTCKTTCAGEVTG